MTDKSEVQRQGIRDAAAEAGRARLEKSVGFPAPGPRSSGAATGGSQAEAWQVNRAAAPDELAKALREPPVAESGSASPIRNGPVEGPLIKTDPAMPPAAQVIAANAMKAYGEAVSHQPEASVVKAIGTAWETAATAEPGASKWAAAGFHIAGDVVKDSAGVRGPDPNIDATLDQAGETVKGAVDRTWPARPRDDGEQGSLIR